MIKKYQFIFLLLLLPQVVIGGEKTRVYILTDISTLRPEVGEPDDTQSMVRLLMYANEFHFEGFGATYTSHDQKAHPELLIKLFDIYGKSEKQLQQYGDYPTSAELIQQVKEGASNKGIEYTGNNYNTELSEDLVQAISRKSEQPLWILVWGGALDLAQALWSMKQSFTPNELDAVLQQARVYAIGDQYDQCGPWIRENFKNLFYITNYSAFRGIYRTGNTKYVSSKWVQENIRSIDAPLAQLYPVYDGGDPWGKVEGVKEGDTPSFLYLLKESPNHPENPQKGGWGGRFQPIKGTHHFTDMKQKVPGKEARKISKYRKKFQKSFARKLKQLKKK